MIEVSIGFNKENVIQLIKSKGHSSVSNQICAAVSILENNFFYSSKVLANVKADLNFKKGYFDFNLIQVENIKTYEILCQSFTIGLESIQKSYNKDLFINKILYN